MRTNDYRIPTLGQYLQREARAEKANRSAEAQGSVGANEETATRYLEGESVRIAQLDAQARVKWHREQAKWHRDQAALLSAGAEWLGGFLPQKK